MSTEADHTTHNTHHVSRPTLTLPAYNRPHALQRLLASLAQADYPAGVRLVISIDPGGEHNAAVRQIAESFAWPFGPKEVIRHEQHLGLIGNVFFCGGLARRYGAVILLEDDLVVSRAFYRYAQQALDYYTGDARIGGISLNALWFNGYTHYPFTPLLDDGDVFFLQVAWYQGQVYTAAQWEAFEAWRAQNRPADPAQMHPLFAQFPPTDWFPLKTRYLVETDRYYVFPRESLTTNFGEVGTHFEHATHFFQVPLQHARRDFRFQTWEAAAAVYDSFQELLPARLNRLTDVLADYDYDVDLHATKAPENLKADYVLTTRQGRNPVRSFGLALRPLAANVIANVPGHGISLYRRSDLKTGRFSQLRTQKRLHDYFTRRPPSRKRQLLFTLLHLLV